MDGYYMNEKTKKAITEVLQSREMKKYFDDFFEHQTEEIKKMLLDTRTEEQNQQNLEELRDELLHKQDTIQILQEKIDKLEKENLNYEEKMKNHDMVVQNCEDFKLQLEASESEKEKILMRKKEYDDRYQKIEAAYEAYQSLPEDMKQRTCAIFGKGDLYSFIKASVEWHNIEGIWEFTKRRIIEEAEEADRIKTLFELMFEVYYLFDDKKRYQLINPDIRLRFDSDKETIKGTKTDGIVEKVLLKGIEDVINQKILFKAIIEVD